MSLSIPYLLAAAVQAAPLATVRCGDQRIAVADLDRMSADTVSTLLEAGYRPGSRHRVSATTREDTLERVASARIGIILSDSDEPGVADGGHLDVLEQRVWSETALIEVVDGAVVTHGDFLGRLQWGSADAGWPTDLVIVVSDLQSAGLSNTSAAGCP